MSRAHRHHLPGFFLRIVHRYHERIVLLCSTAVVLAARRDAALETIRVGLWRC